MLEPPYKEYYDIVVRHFQKIRIWERIVRRFPPKAIEYAVKDIYERFLERGEDPKELDWAAAFELLEDYETIDDFLKALERMGLIPPKMPEVEQLTSLEDLLKKLGLELPAPDDPYATEKMKDIIRELAERLEEAEYMKGRIKVKVAGKTRIWGSEQVYKFVDELNRRIRQLEEEKAKVEEALKRTKEELEKAKKAMPYTYKMVTLKFTQHVPAFIGVDGKVYGPFYAGHIVAVPEPDADKLIRQGLAQPWAIVAKPPREAKPIPPEIIKRIDELWKQVKTLIAAGETPDDELRELRKIRETYKPSSAR